MNVPPGVVTGEDLFKLLSHAKKNSYAIPAFNCTTSSACNAAMEAGNKNNGPIMIQISNDGGAFFAGKSLKDPNAQAAGAVAMALHVRSLATYYGIPVVLSTDHCSKKRMLWFEAMIDADESYYNQYGEPLFSMHMLDLSEEFHDENIAICTKYLRRLSKINIWLEIAIGITKNEVDNVKNKDEDPELYASPEQVYAAYKALSQVDKMFSIAAAFGNAHGVYKSGKVSLQPERLANIQAYTKEKIGTKEGNPLFLVMHGGSGSTPEEIAAAVRNGVVKVNVDTDCQWAYWNGVRKYEVRKRGFLQGQIGNPNEPDEPNKKHYDPRVWLRKAEESMTARCGECMKSFSCNDTYPARIPDPCSVPAFNFVAGEPPNRKSFQQYSAPSFLRRFVCVMPIDGPIKYVYLLMVLLYLCSDT